MKSYNWKSLVLWVASVVLGIFFAVVGINKFVDPKHVKVFADKGFADWFRVLIASIEIGGGLLLLVPPVATYAAGALGIVMIGAIGTHLRWGENSNVIVPSVLLILLSALGYARRPWAGKPTATEPVS